MHNVIHVNQYKAGKKESYFMLRHATGKHGGDKKTRFMMRRTATDKYPLRRVIQESMQIVVVRDNDRIKPYEQQ